MNKILSESNEIVDDKRVNTKVIEIVFTKKDDELQLLQYESQLSQITKQIEYYKNKGDDVVEILEIKKRNIKDKISEQEKIIQSYF